jgi:hypothetical protein
LNRHESSGCTPQVGPRGGSDLPRGAAARLRPTRFAGAQAQALSACGYGGGRRRRDLDRTVSLQAARITLNALAAGGPQRTGRGSMASLGEAERHGSAAAGLFAAADPPEPSTTASETWIPWIAGKSKKGRSVVEGGGGSSDSSPVGPVEVEWIGGDLIVGVQPGAVRVGA